MHVLWLRLSNPPPCHIESQTHYLYTAAWLSKRWLAYFLTGQGAVSYSPSREHEQMIDQELTGVELNKNRKPPRHR